MIEQGPSSYEVSCDTCSYQEAYHVVKWNDLMVLMREAGWVSRLVDTSDEAGWQHYCPSCMEN